MRLVGTKTIQEGQKLAMPIYTTSGKIMLNAGVILTENYIKRLSLFNVYKVYIHDARFEDIVIYSPLDWETKKFASLVIGDTIINISKHKSIDGYIINDTSEKIVNYVLKSKSAGVSLLNLNANDEHIIEHSINVAILSCFIGIKLHYNYRQLIELVAGALLHDVGRDMGMDESPDHPEKAFQILRNCSGLSLNSAIVSYEHHESYDGSGYPRKIIGTNISLNSRIVHIADDYDKALRGLYSDGVSLMPHQAYEVILALSAQILDPVIVQTFRDIIVFYPNGCTVELNSGLRGVVVKQNLGSPHRPIVRPLEANKNERDVDLLKNLTLLINDVLAA